MSKIPNPKNLTLREKLKRKFFPTPSQLVEDVNARNYYPSGRAYWQIAPKIVNSTAISPKEKMELLLDFYGKYYIYQQKGTVNFSVYENYYEQIVFKRDDGSNFVNRGRYEKLFNELLSENSYIINRTMKDQADTIIAQAQQEGVNKIDFIESLGEKSKGILYLSHALQDDFYDKLVFDVYCPSREETYIKDLLMERYFDHYPQHLEEIKQAEPFPEFMSKSRYQRPSMTGIPIPTGIGEVITTIKEGTQKTSLLDEGKIPEK